MAINPTPIENSRITIRLAPNNLTGSATWDTADGANLYGADNFYKAAEIVQIPNTLDKIATFNPGANVEIGASTQVEINGSIPNFGGVFVSPSGWNLNTAITVTLDPNTGVRNTLTVTDLVSTHIQKCRGNTGVTFSMIMHGEIDSKGITSGEYKFVQRNDTAAAFDATTFYKESAYISFHSNEAPTTVTPTISLNRNFSLRKGFHHGIVRLGATHLRGLSLSNVLNGFSYLDPTNFTIWNDFPDLIPGTTCNFNTYTAAPALNETVSANGPGQTPTTISCVSKTLKFIGFENGLAKFQNATATSLFSNVTPAYQHNGKINYGDSTYGGLYTIVAGQTLTIRPQYSPTFGSKNLLAFKPAAGGIRLFGGTTNIGVQAGSYVQLSGFSTASNNGIYQVLATYDGIAGDTNENISQTGSLPPFQYLELSRDITPENDAGALSITIRNVTSLPVLHIKYI